MALDVFIPARPPVLGLKRSVTGRTLDAALGDGYTQSAPDGLNPVLGKWAPSWPALENGFCDDIELFLTSHLGKTFKWTPPGRDVTYKVRCKVWDRTQVTGRYDAITAQFEEVADLDE